MRKLATRYDGTRATIHRAIAQGTMTARPGYVWAVFTTGLHKGHALECPANEFKYRGQYLPMLAESAYLSEDR